MTPPAADPTRVVRRLGLALLIVQVLFVVLDVVFNLVDVTGDSSIRRIVNPARETSLPTWFASTQAFAVGAVAAAVALARFRSGQTRDGWLWCGVCAFFVYVSADDAAELHEGLSSAIVRSSAEGHALHSLPTYAWQLLIGPALAAGLLFSAAVVAWSGSRRARVLVGAGLLGFALSQGLDAWEGMASTEAFLHATAARWDTARYTMTHTPRLVEEVLEMLSTTAFLLASLLVLQERGTPA